jgi:hypothetical protein
MTACQKLAQKTQTTLNLLTVMRCRVSAATAAFKQHVQKWAAWIAIILNAGVADSASPEACFTDVDLLQQMAGDALTA